MRSFICLHPGTLLEDISHHALGQLAPPSVELQYEQTPVTGAIACMLTFKHNFSVDVSFAAAQAAAVTGSPLVEYDKL